MPPAPETRALRTTVWRNHGEVFDLARDGDSILAATNGGLLRDGKPLPSPSGLRSIEGVHPLVVALSDGRRLRQEGTKWVPAGSAERPRDLDHGLLIDPGSPWPGPTPPPAHPYAALRVGNRLFAGTADGLYRLEGRAWSRETLPDDLPLARPNGLAVAGGTFVVGGLGGLYVGRPGAWRKASGVAIRQVVTVGNEIWAVHGDGALDKVDPVGDRLYPDVLVGNAQRPWTSCVGWDGERALFGGQGGWAEQGAGARFLAELKGDVVTALAGRPDVRFIGSQKAGLLRVRGPGIRRWNPGNGLRDTWVTALLLGPQGLLVGTARDGLYRLVGDRLSEVPSPTRRVTALALWKGRVVVGGMDGAWITNGTSWSFLPTGGEETTSLAVLSRRLAVTTASGVFLDP